MFYRQWVKPAADRVVAAFGLIALFPVLCLLGAAVRLKLGSPVVFRQMRIGMNDRPFEFLKFRTMTNARDDMGSLLPDAERLKPFGAFLRSSSLDELPQLWNVLKGEMSLIGPRPLLPEYLPRYSPVQRRRHAVRPGITGLAQVKGRNALSWDEKFQLDVDYVDRCGAALDIELLCKTLYSVLTRKGISREGHATSPPFIGSAPLE